MSAWHASRTVRFGHCDPAGIVFYPRYFEIVHEVEEDWFRDALGLPFREMIGERREGFPVVALSTRFHAPSRLGDVLEVGVGVLRIGRSSLDIRYAVACRNEPRADIDTTIVHIDLVTGRSLPIEGELLRRLEACRIGPAGGAEGE